MVAQDPDQAATAMQQSPPSWPAAGPPAAPSSSSAGALTVGSILTVAGILLLFVFFAFGIVALQYCFNAWDRERQGSRSGRRSGGGGGNGAAARTRGVDPEVLRALPVTVYRRAAPGPNSKEDDAAVECAVCLAELEDGEEARFLPRCGHGFHAECVDMWLASHTTCPLCRLTVGKPDASPAPALPPVPPEPANYDANLPASVLLGVSVSDRGAVAASPSAGAAPVLVIEIPESTLPALTPRDTMKSPGSARLRSIRRLWSFGRQGAGASSSCAGACEGADVEQGIGIADVALQSEPESAGSTRRAAGV